MRSALDMLSRIPREDIAALMKLRDGSLPEPQPLESPALLIVDMNEAFVRDEYPTGWAATGGPCLRVVAELCDAMRRNGLPIIYTTSEHLKHDALVGQWRRGEMGKEIAPFRERGDAHRIADEIRPADEDIVLVKAKPSGFFGTQLAGILHALGTRSLIVTGMTTSGCVRATVVDAFSLNYHVVVPLDGVADRSALSHEVSLFDMGAKYADVVTTADVVAALSSGEC